MLDGFQLVDVHLHAARKTTLKLPWDTWVQGFADRDVMDRLYDSAGAVIPAAFDAMLAGEGVDTGLLMSEYSHISSPMSTPSAASSASNSAGITVPALS